MNSDNFTIIILGRQSSSTRIIFNAMKNKFFISQVIIEQPISLPKFLKNRIKKLGAWKVFGQVLFQLLLIPLLKIGSEKRILEIKKQHQLQDEAIDEAIIKNVSSANNDETIELLKKANPDAVIISGSRILSQQVLESIPAKFINIHAGITPLYRGVHGAYWALANNDLENCGVTVHLTDAGIDTGEILKQKKITVFSKDNFATYPLLQLAEGINLLEKILADLQSGNILFSPNNSGKSKLWYHPTLSEYIWNRVVKGVK